LKKNKKSLIAVQGPTQFIAAYIAFRWCEEKIWFKESEVTLLVYDTCVPVENEILFQNSIQEIAAIGKFHKVIFISQLEIQNISKQLYSKCITDIKSLIGEEHFDYVYLARNFGSFSTKLIPSAYSKALKIEYGDSFGLVGNEKEEELSYLDFLKRPMCFLKSTAKKIIFGHFPKHFVFDLSVLTMPLVWDVNYLKDKNLIIPEKLFVNEIFSNISKQLTKLDLFCEELIANANGKCNVYLLSNLFNSGFCTLENEVKLYEEIILETALPGERLILKNHPRCSDEVLIQLKEKLNQFFDVVIVTDKQFSFIPIELWTVLLKSCKVFPIFSTSAISLQYLYSKQVSMTLDHQKIKKYVFFNKRQETIIGVDMCYKSIDVLENWDVKTPLWIKNI
jgi:hypothetical protein